MSPFRLCLALLLLPSPLAFTAPPLPFARQPPPARAPPLGVLPEALADLASRADLASLDLASLASLQHLPSSLLAADSFTPSYSSNSYRATLFLYLLSFPGLWSTIKRSTKAKSKRKVYETPGAAKGGKELPQVAGEIMAYMKANNYEVKSAGETITFQGLVQKSRSQAFFLTFCTALCLASLALVLQIQFIDYRLPGVLGGGEPNWFLVTLASPYAGLYYWREGDRVDELQLKLVEADDGGTVDINVVGDEEELER